MMKNTVKLKLSNNQNLGDIMSETYQIQATESESPSNKLQELEIDKIPSPTLARLIEEVRNEEELSAHAYNRMHNRHNRSR
jgi:hypothetical protein